eukprot:gnl/TRDRNA2_/TRDRNA2_176265_c0_seq3.p1 gnl/TRDRNA2_/TRDRNA2_176265_c0~~gnl/TRDRNA2_/TRDRNA2_176265_c0_seq3.p1  ORF type:complete len:269 (+),score=-1.52 gnl/TRDRNA2_/TRDRNA2_176265_c0_seq3:72-878(+)
MGITIFRTAGNIYQLLLVIKLAPCHALQMVFDTADDLHDPSSKLQIFARHNITSSPYGKHHCDKPGGGAKPDANIDFPSCGGERTEPLTYEVPFPVGVEHSNLYGKPSNREAEEMNLWMYPASNKSSATLFYTPRKVIEFHDHVDMVRYLGYDYDCRRKSVFKNGSRTGSLVDTPYIMKLANPVLSKRFDTIKFSHHLDVSWMNRCNAMDRQERRCFFLQEWVALHSWTPYACPGHPSLSLANGPCNCSWARHNRSWATVKYDELAIC